MKWNYESPTTSSSGYEDVLDELKKYNKDIYRSSSEDKQKEMIEEMFAIYRSKNIYPIIYYNEEGIKKEIQKCIDKEVSFIGDTLNLKFNQGSSLCRFLFPNLALVECKGAQNNSPFRKFQDDSKLKKL